MSAEHEWDVEPRLTGSEHYRRAELLLQSCKPAMGKFDQQEDDGVHEPYGAVDDDEPGVDICRNALMAAQIHATLAVAAGLRPTYENTPTDSPSGSAP